MKARKILPLIIVLAMVVTMFSGCGGTGGGGGQNPSGGDSGGSAQPVQKDTITIANAADIVSLDPSGQNDVVSQLVVDAMYNRLYSLDENLNVVPDLAESYENPSPKEWRIKIKQGVKFHDGSELTADDVKASLDKAREAAEVKHVLDQIVDIKVEDANTVLITTKDQYAPFLNTLAHFGSSIVPKAYLESGDNFQKPIGSGPFKFKDRVLGDSVTLERFDDYFVKDGVAKCKTLIFKSIPEGATRTIALETGQVDAVSSLSATDYDRVSSNANLKIYEKASNQMQYMGININQGNLKDKRVRQAINYAVNKEAIMKIAINSKGKIANTVLPESLLGYVENPGNYSFDPEKAKELLSQAGLADGFSVKLWTSGDVRNKIAQVIQSNLAAINIKADIEQFEWSKYLEATNSGDQQLFLLAWTAEPDPDQVLPSLFAKSSIKGQNRSEFTNDQVEGLMENARKELDSAKRKTMYEEIQKVIMDEAPWAPLYYPNFVIAANKDLQGVSLNAKAMCYLNKLGY